MKRLFVLLSLVVLSVTTYASGIKFTEFELDNGLKVILHQDNSTPIVVVSVMYHVGSKNEDTARTGFAHFFEHLLFEGSENIPRGQFDKLITNAGGNNNAYTSNDKTYYFETLPSNQLELGLYLESERMLHAKIEDIGVETQREVVKEEKRLRYDNQPYGMILIEVLRHAYKEHPYRWAPIGSMDHLNAATLEEFMEFYNTFYVPNNACLAIAGDLDIEETKKLVKLYFGDIPRGTNPIPRPDIVEPPITEERRAEVFDKVQLPAVIAAYPMPAQGTHDAYALEVLGNILSGGQSSRMYRSIVDEQQKALVVLSFPFSSEDPGLYLVYGIANMGISAEDLEAAMNAEIVKVQQELVTETEFQKAMNQIENDDLGKISTLSSVADNLATYKLFYGDANLINTEIERYRKVTREDLKRVANKYLQQNSRVLLHWLPAPQN
jgi:zinc protease